MGASETSLENSLRSFRRMINWSKRFTIITPAVRLNRSAHREYGLVSGFCRVGEKRTLPHSQRRASHQDDALRFEGKTWSRS
jgi:hypothetical protein